MAWLRHRTTRWYVLAAVVAAALLGVYLAACSPAARRQISQSTSRQPAAFTELYFSDPSQLPKHLSASAPNSFGFTIANHEGAAVTYPYAVTTLRAGQTQTIATGDLPLASGATGTATVVFTPAQTGVYLFTVSLVGRSESIHFTGTS